MTVKDIQNKINKFAAEHPDLLNEPVVTDCGWLRIGRFIEDEPASEENDYAPDGYWQFGETLMILPEDTKEEC